MWQWIALLRQPAISSISISIVSIPLRNLLNTCTLYSVAWMLWISHAIAICVFKIDPSFFSIRTILRQKKRLSRYFAVADFTSPPACHPPPSPPFPCNSNFSKYKRCAKRRRSRALNPELHGMGPYRVGIEWPLHVQSGLRSFSIPIWIYKEEFFSGEF